MQCPSCGAEIAVGNVFPGASVKCASCSAQVQVPDIDSAPAAIPVSASAAQPKRTTPCPQCKSELAMRDADGELVSACPLGHGLFVTHATLRELEATQRENPHEQSATVDELDTKPSIEREVRTRMCPRCGDAMTRRAFARNATVVVDVCGEHGTWFDGGELRAALAATPMDGEEAATSSRLIEQSKATLDVALALENAREDELSRRNVEVAEDIVDLFNVALFGRQLGYRRHRDRW